MPASGSEAGLARESPRAQPGAQVPAVERRGPVMEGEPWVSMFLK